MDERTRSRRRIALLVLAVVVPSIAIIALGTRLLAQEDRLSESRRVEAVDRAFRDFATTLDTLGRRIALEARPTLRPSAIPPGPLAGAESLVVFATPARRVPGLGRSPGVSGDAAWSRALRDAETLEFGRADPQSAADAYRSAVDHAPSIADAAQARLGLIRTLTRSGQSAAARSARGELAALPPEVTDEFGVPYALYALESEPDADVRLAALERHADQSPDVSPAAAAFYRALRDSLRSSAANPRFTAFTRFVDRAVNAARLREDLPSLLPLLHPPGDSLPGWMLYADDAWLLTLAGPEDSARIVVLDATATARRAAETAGLPAAGFAQPSIHSAGTPPARYLGPRFAGMYGIIPAHDLSGVSSRRLTAFLGLSALFVIGLLALGVGLIWRDTRRDLETARLRSDFVSSVSHELKTPLTSIRMFAETMRVREQPAEVRAEYLDTIICESRRLTRLLNNVLDFSRIERGTQRYDLAPVAVQRVVESAIDALNPSIRADGFSLETEVPDEDIVVRADADALEQVVLNLLSNAVKYSGESRHVALRVIPNGHRVSIRVEDQGVGIEEKDLPHLFEPYFRAHRATEPRVAGTGLGLAIVKHTVDAHGGQVDVASRPGRGTTVTVTLDRA